MPGILQVLVAALLPMVIGALWYGPLFGKQWMSMVGRSEEEIRSNFNPIKTFGGTYLSYVVMGYVLAVILQAWQDAYDMTGWSAGMQGAFWCWLGFVVAFGWQSVAYEDRSLKLYGLNMAYNLVSLLAMGALLGVWR